MGGLLICQFTIAILGKISTMEAGKYYYKSPEEN